MAAPEHPSPAPPRSAAAASTDAVSTGAASITGGAAIAAAVAALPMLPPIEPADRYGVRRLTAAWLAELDSVHTRRGYFRDLAAFLGWCQTQGLDPLTARAADLGQYRVALRHSTPQRNRPAAVPTAATVARRLSAISSWYRYLVANSDGQLSVNPMSGVRRPRTDRDTSVTVGLTVAEVQALLTSADEQARARAGALPTDPTARQLARYLAALRDRALVRVLADLGLRVGEGLARDIDALSYNRGHRTLRFVSKGGRVRERAISGHALEAVDEYLAVRAQLCGTPVAQLTGPLFATTSSDGSAGRLDEPAAFRLIRRLAGHAGLPSAHRLSPHSLRHAFATNARELGIPLEDVQDAMGHADARTTRRYDRDRHALHREPGLRLGVLYADRADDHQQVRQPEARQPEARPAVRLAEVRSTDG